MNRGKRGKIGALLARATGMDIELNAPVVTSDGAQAGKVDKVIFDPEKGQARSIVLRKGMLLSRDVAVAIEDVRMAAPGRAELTLTKQQVDELPDFVETDYRVPPEDWLPPYGWAGSGVLWPGSAMALGGYGGAYGLTPTANPLPREVSERLRQDDLENATVDRGSEVVTRDGEKIGEVANLVVDEVTKRASRLVVRRGILFTEDVELPGPWIESFDDHSVMLRVDKQAVEDLAHQHKGA
ncbi:MAG: PRC-barrel domain-containing protein [Chloroflexota bacterium]